MSTGRVKTAILTYTDSMILIVHYKLVHSSMIGQCERLSHKAKYCSYVLISGWLLQEVVIGMICRWNDATDAVGY
jgi:hypothetical protein